MAAALSVFLINLALGQLISTFQGWRAVSLVGPGRLAGYGLSILLFIIGAGLLPPSWGVLLWALPAGPAVLAVLLVGGSFIAPPSHPDQLFEAARLVQIPDGDYLMPGFLFQSRHTIGGEKAPAICVVPGAGDTKIAFKWRLVQALLAEGFAVLTIDTPGHGDYRQRPMEYPDCLSAVPAAIRFLQAQPDVSGIGLLTISLGGALAIRSLIEAPTIRELVKGMVVLATPIDLNYSRGMVYREAWNAFRAPVLSLFREISVRQLRQSWFTGGYRSPYSTAELINLFDPVEGAGRIKDMPLMLVYSARDCIAPLAAGRAMKQAAPEAACFTAKKASHVTLILVPQVTRQMASWLRQQIRCHRSDLRAEEGITSPYDDLHAGR